MKRFIIFLAALFLASPIALSEIDETRTTLREHVLKLINKDRKLFNLPPVQLDLPASTIADEFCREQIRTGTTGHFGIDGHSPYMRYSFAGGNDGLSENAAAWSANYTFSDRALYEMSRRSQDAMMGEMPPSDGHRRTILDPYSNYVGIGVAWEKGEFRLMQEFLRRYVEWTRALPRHAQIDEPVSASGHALKGVRIEAITVHHEAFPEPMPPLMANAIHTYSLPNDRREYLPRLHQKVTRRDDGTIEIIRHEYSDGTRGDFYLGDDGAFSFAVPFTEGEGIYTVVVWVRKDGAPQAFAASNVSIRVERSLPSARAAWPNNNGSSRLPTTQSSSVAVPRD